MSNLSRVGRLRSILVKAAAATRPVDEDVPRLNSEQILSFFGFNGQNNEGTPHGAAEAEGQDANEEERRDQKLRDPMASTAQSAPELHPSDSSGVGLEGSETTKMASPLEIAALVRRATQLQVPPTRGGVTPLGPHAAIADYNANRRYGPQLPNPLTDSEQATLERSKQEMSNSRSRVVDARRRAREETLGRLRALFSASGLWE